jgi:hypothetical protein|eukprot:COSAG02_NODE_429_length_22473_cov_38.587691_1_plen_114_part_00
MCAGTQAVVECSFMYFLSDTIMSAVARKWDVVFAHHVPTLILFGGQVVFPIMQEDKWGSRILLIELSTPLLTRWRRSKRKDHFQQFMLVFFFVRVCYLPYLNQLFFENFGYPK